MKEAKNMFRNNKKGYQSWIAEAHSSSAHFWLTNKKLTNISNKICLSLNHHSHPTLNINQRHQKECNKLLFGN